MKWIVAILLVAGVAHADDKRADAERYFKAGAKAYAAQSFAAAAADFDEAYKALPMPEIAFSAAQAYRRLYRVDPKPEYVRRAVELYRVYLEKVKTGGRVGDAADSLGELEREMDRLKIKVGAGETKQVERTRIGVNISIEGAADTAALHEIGDATGESIKGLVATIDGKPAEPFALVEVPPGEHVVTASADGYFPVEKKHHAVAGVTSLVEVALKPKPAKVTVTTEADATVLVDGRPASRSAGTSIELAQGAHLIAILHGGREPFAKEVTVTRGQELALSAPLVKTGQRRAVPWVLGTSGVLAAGAAVATITALVHDSRASDLRTAIDGGNRPVSDGDAYSREVKSRDDAKTAAYILGGGAAIAGITGALLYYLDSPSERIKLAPMSTAGVSVTGRF
jgi:hypothetical protein